MNSNCKKLLQCTMIAGIIVIIFEGIFVNFTIDSEYAITQSYRMVRGDGLFLQMWEPHQTSAFLCAGLIALWLKITGSVNGVVLFLHIVGLLVKLGILFIFQKTIKPFCGTAGRFAIAVTFLATSPKKLLLLEFSNMQLYFSVLLFCSLVLFFQNQKKWFYLIFAAFFLFMEVLSYPSSVLVYFIVIFLLFRNSQNKIRNSLIFTGVFGICGLWFVFHYIQKLGLRLFIECVKQIIMEDSSHTGVVTDKWLIFGRDVILVSLFYLCLAGLSFLLFRVIVFVMQKKGKKMSNARFTYLIIFSILLILEGCIKNFIQVSYFQPRKGLLVWLDLEDWYLPVIGLGMYCLRFCDDTQKRLVKTGIAISVGNMIATLLLTNLGLNHAIGYMGLSLVISFISIEQGMKQIKSCEEKKNYGLANWVLGLLLLAIVFKNAFIIQNSVQTHYNYNIFEVRNVVKHGPVLGILSDYMGPYIMNKNLEEWPELVKPGDNLLIVGGDKLSTIGYLYENVNICVDSTICTPTFTEKLLRYWELNPDKKPNVVLISSWYGDLKISEDSWIFQWIEKEFGEPYAELEFMRCYRKELGKSD